MSPGFPLVSIPGIPTVGEVCLWHVHKVLEGGRTDKFENPYPCPEGPTERGFTHVELMILSAGSPCDEDPKLIPDKGSLKADGHTLLRVKDGLAHFFGEFRIYNPAPANKLLFLGEIELFQRIGSHAPPFGEEPCNLAEHVEGWIIGKGYRVLPRWTIRAFLVGKGWVRETGGDMPLEARLNGVVIRIP